MWPSPKLPEPEERTGERTSISSCQDFGVLILSQKKKKRKKAGSLLFDAGVSPEVPDPVAQNLSVRMSTQKGRQWNKLHCEDLSNLCADLAPESWLCSTKWTPHSWLLRGSAVTWHVSTTCSSHSDSALTLNPPGTQGGGVNEQPVYSSLRADVWPSGIETGNEITVTVPQWLRRDSNSLRQSALGAFDYAQIVMDTRWADWDLLRLLLRRTGAEGWKDLATHLHVIPMKARLQLDLPRKSDTLACSSKDSARGRERIEDREREDRERTGGGGGC